MGTMWDSVWTRARAFGIAVDPDGVILDVTDSVMSLFEIPRETIVGSAISSWFVPKDGLRGVFRTSTRDLPVRYTEAGNDPRMMWFEDATDLVAAEDSSSDYKEELRQLEYAVSHDLMEPLRNVTTSLSLHEKSPMSPEHVENAFVNARQIHKLLLDFLAYLRLDTRKQRQDLMHEVDLNVLIEDVMQSLRLMITETGADIRYKDLPSVHGDSRMLYQVFSNLIANAIKFRAPERACVIDITAKSFNDRWVVNVTDNGRGIPQSKRERIWVPFARVHKNENIPGSGIGLAIVKRCVRYHGGDIEVYSQVDAGTTMSMALPMNPTA